MIPSKPVNEAVEKHGDIWLTRIAMYGSVPEAVWVELKDPQDPFGVLVNEPLNGDELGVHYGDVVAFIPNPSGEDLIWVFDHELTVIINWLLPRLQPAVS